MGRLNRQQVAAKTKARIKASKAGLPKYKLKDEVNFISPDKVKINDHHAKRKIIVGAKDSGKTRPTALRMLGLVEEDKDNYGLALRKYKSGAVGRLYTSINNLALEIGFAGYNIDKYEKGVSQMYRMVNFRNKSENQSIEFASFDDANGLAGIEAPNLGKIPMVWIEEPVLLDDPGKLPNKKEWEAQMKTIEDSVDRSNRRYANIHKTPKEKVQYYFTANAWDEHPIVEELERAFPEAEFLEWVMKDIEKNHTKAKYDKISDTLYVRNTKFANPELENKQEWIKKAKKAVYEEDSYELARILGLRYEGSETNGKTWNLRNLKTANVNEIISCPEVKIESFCIGIDIDHRRRLVLTPIYGVTSTVLFRESKKNLLVGEQIEIPCYGNGEMGSFIPIYAKSIVDKSIESWQNMVKCNNAKLPNVSMMYLDDDKQHYSVTIAQDLMHYFNINRAKKHGPWGIKERTDLIQILIDGGHMIIDEKNTRLIDDMKKSVIKEGFDKRDESGKREKDYDFINSFEYALYPFRAFAYSAAPLGDIEWYNQFIEKKAEKTAKKENKDE